MELRFLLLVSTSEIRIPYISIQKIFMMYYLFLIKDIRYTLILNKYHFKRNVLSQ